MQGRTFFRIMLENLFVNNALCKALSALVNFCNEQSYYGKKELKFLKKMPLTKVEKNSVSQNRYIFTSALNSGAQKK